MLAYLGAFNSLIIMKPFVFQRKQLTSFEAPYELIRKMRASFLVTGPLLAGRKGRRVFLFQGAVLSALVRLISI